MQNNYNKDQINLLEIMEINFKQKHKHFKKNYQIYKININYKYNKFKNKMMI